MCSFELTLQRVWVSRKSSGTYEVVRFLDAVRGRGQTQEAVCLLVDVSERPGEFQELLDVGGLRKNPELVRQVVMKLLSDIAVHVNNSAMMEKAMLLLWRMLAEEWRPIRQAALNAIAHVAHNLRDNDLMNRTLLTLIKVVKEDQHVLVREAALRAIPVAVVNSTDNDIVVIAVFALESVSRQNLDNNVREVAAHMFAELALTTSGHEWVDVAGHTIQRLLDKREDFVVAVSQNEMILDAIAKLASCGKKHQVIKKAMFTLEALLYQKALKLMQQCVDQEKKSDLKRASDAVLRCIVKVAADSEIIEWLQQAFGLLREKLNEPGDPSEWVSDLVKVAFISTDVHLLRNASETVNALFVEPQTEFEVKAIAQAAVNSAQDEMMKDALLLLEKVATSKKSSVKQASVRAIAAVAVNAKDGKLMKQRALIALKTMRDKEKQTKTTMAFLQSACALMTDDPSCSHLGLVTGIPASIFD